MSPTVRTTPTVNKMTSSAPLDPELALVDCTA
jgi:hypothetical protein